MNPQNKLLKRCEDNFNEETQEFTNEIPEEILDCIIEVIQEWWPDFEDEAYNDFVNDFICSKIIYWKYWKIVRIWLKELFKEETEHLFD